MPPSTTRGALIVGRFKVAYQVPTVAAVDAACVTLVTARRGATKLDKARIDNDLDLLLARRLELTRRPAAVS